MKSLLISCCLAIAMLFLQSTWLSHGIFLGIIPNLSLAVILFASFLNKDGQGIIVAFLSGLAADMMSSAPLGYFAFLFSVCAYITTLLSYITEKDFFIIPFLFGSGSTIAIGILSKILQFVFSSSIRSYEIFSAEFGVEVVLNGLSTALIFFVLSFVRGFFEHRPKKAIP